MTESLHPADGGVGGDVHALGYIGDILAGEGGGRAAKKRSCSELLRRLIWPLGRNERMWVM